ncbi:agmatine deiminase family protein [Sulfurimonas paralvinellae]|uniref:Agmatine deiminase family protein n=1 Tax=Sulfurimonas paralvinellae TaxID=317658 RepID=A0A7M1B8B4_9BACT|nr:agmatine deiminase family protein [Sulfurimonas paralvinellae]QOP45028.1 agmatine deiminase family protein [Sulfurimonas paralvinellae]
MRRLIAEFEPQSFTQVIFPHAGTDWAPYLHEAETCFTNIINNIARFQPCLIICHDVAAVKQHFPNKHNLHFVAYETNDTWARDCSALGVSEDKTLKLLDFTFNAWGGKFEAQKDNAMSAALQTCYKNELKTIDFILEGGAVESNGLGTILTTAQCMLNPNRNPLLNNIQITERLHEIFGAKHILYLNHGYLAGDDTDSHIDTLARFIDERSIMYVECEDENDEHFHQLQLMKEELQMIAKENDLRLIALPMPSAVFYDNERLPATYANFLFVNGAVLVPTYNVPQDAEALQIFQKIFPNKEIVPIDSSVLIRQHGSLHCVTMNFAAGVGLSC